MTAFINDSGHLLKQWAVDLKAALATSLHDGSWFQVGELDTVILAPTGGRQGCKLGALVFNSRCSVASQVLNWEFKRHGLILRLSIPGAAF
eukprot:11204662-Karenia_brevis.AAC.1